MGLGVDNSLLGWRLLSERFESSSGGQQRDVFAGVVGVEAAQDGLLGLGRPVDAQVFSGSGDGRVEDVVCDVVFVGVGDDDLNGVVFQSLCLVDADGIGDLEGNGGNVVVFVFVAGIQVVYREPDGGVGDPIETVVTLCVELGDGAVKRDIELVAFVECSDGGDCALQVVVDEAAETVVIAEQHRVVDFVDGWAPRHGGVGVAGLQEAVDVVDAIEAYRDALSFVE